MSTAPDEVLAPTHTAEPDAEGEPPVPYTRFEEIMGHPPGLYILFFSSLRRVLSCRTTAQF